MNREHTLAPWRQDGTRVIGLDDVVVAVCRQAKPRCTRVALANAAFITRACNHHAELLACCQSLLSIVADAIMHGMPITKEVADARNKAVKLISECRITGP